MSRPGDVAAAASARRQPVDSPPSEPLAASIMDSEALTVMTASYANAAHDSPDYCDLLLFLMLMVWPLVKSSSSSTWSQIGRNRPPAPTEEPPSGPWAGSDTCCVWAGSR